MPVEPSSVQTLPVRSSGEVLAAGSVDGKAEHPYLLARNLRANAYLDLARTLTNYRLLAAALLVVNLALSAGLLWLSSRTRIVPYVVEIDRAGFAVSVGPADELPRPDRALVIHEIARWLRNVRGVSRDPDVQRRLILDAYAYTGGRGVALLNDWFRAQAPFARAAKETVSVEVLSVLALSTEDRSWQVQWRETARSTSGRDEGSTTWQGVLTTEVEPPERIEEVVTNPLGIRVVDFDWTRLPDTDPGDPR